jgi:hypothetical protein
MRSPRAVWILAERFGDMGESEDGFDDRHRYDARLFVALEVQFQGEKSSMRLTGWSARRAKMSVR